MGGQDNAMTSSDFTAYYQQVHKKFLPNVMEMEADRMVNLVLSENAVATERKVILEERSSVIDSNPQRLFMEEMYSNLFRNHPYKTPIIGWRHEMETLSKQDALDFYKRFYAPNNAILVISGDVEAEEAIKLAEEKYGHIPANNNISPAIEWAEPDILSKRTFVMTNTQANLPFLQRSYQLPSYATGKSDHELLSLQVLSYILGGYDNSIIYNKLVRDTGLASYTSINYDASRRGSSLLSISVVPIEDDEESIDKIINIIDETLAHTQITADRLRVAKKSLLADSVYARDGYMGGAMLIGEALALNLDIDVVEKWPEAISKITLEDVQNSLDKLAKRDDHVTGLLKLAE
jgi:zinc protease